MAAALAAALASRVVGVTGVPGVPGIRVAASTEASWPRRPCPSKTPNKKSAPSPFSSDHDDDPFVMDDMDETCGKNMAKTWKNLGKKEKSETSTKFNR